MIALHSARASLPSMCNSCDCRNDNRSALVPRCTMCGENRLDDHCDRLRHQYARRLARDPERKRVHARCRGCAEHRQRERPFSGRSWPKISRSMVSHTGFGKLASERIARSDLGDPAEESHPLPLRRSGSVDRAGCRQTDHCPETRQPRPRCSGMRRSTAELMVRIVDEGFLPAIPAQGSVGARAISRRWPTLARP